VVRGLDGGEDAFERLEVCISTTAVCTSMTGCCPTMAVCEPTTGGAVCAELVPVPSQMTTVLVGCLEPAMEASVLGPFAFLALLQVVRGFAKDGVRDDSVLLSLRVMC
jgi:hypothetical protein